MDKYDFFCGRTNTTIQNNNKNNYKNDNNNNNNNNDVYIDLQKGWKCKNYGDVAGTYKTIKTTTSITTTTATT